MPEFCCASLSADAATAQPGGTMRVRTNVWNAGNAAGTHQVDVLLDGVKVDSRQVSLGSGMDAMQSFDLPAPPPGAHVVSVEGKTFGVLVP